MPLTKLVAIASDHSAESVTEGCKGGGVTKKHMRVPDLIVGFDTETTGLDVKVERAISYGFCVYRFGQLERSEHFYVVPDRPISEGARKVHGLTTETLESLRSTASVFSLEDGLTRALSILQNLHEQGAYIVGANVVRFDLEMMRRSIQSVSGITLDRAPFNVATLRIIDVIEHDLVIEPGRVVRPRRGLNFLCAHYGVVPGGHDALNDARATIEVFLRQVLHNNGGQMAMEFGPSLQWGRQVMMSGDSRLGGVRNKLDGW